MVAIRQIAQEEILFMECPSICLSPNQHYDVFESAEKLGSLYYYQGDLDNARKYFELALEARERSVGNNIELLQIPINNLALVLLKQNKTEKAKQYLINPGTMPHEPFPVAVSSFGFASSPQLLIPGESVEPPADILLPES